MTYTRREFVAAMGAAAAATALPLARAEGMRRNVVFVLGDDHRADLLGCAGHPFLKTPNLDKLAQEGLRYSNACVTSAICCASRAGILTGMHPARHRVIDFSTRIRDAHWQASYPQLFRNAGYRTGFFGKFGVAGDSAPTDLFDTVMAPAYGPYYFPKDNPSARHADDLHCEAAEKFIEAQAAAGASLLCIAQFPLTAFGGLRRKTLPTGAGVSDALFQHRDTARARSRRPGLRSIARLSAR